MAGARKPGGKITQPHNFGSSSATYFATPIFAGRIVTFAGGSLPSSRAAATSARPRKYASGGTDTPPSQTTDGTRRFLTRYSCTSALVRTNWSQSTVTGSVSVGTALAGPKKVSVKAYDADGTRSLVFSLT